MKRLLSTILALCLLLGLLPVITSESQALCGTTGGNMDIILILDHSNSMYPPTSDNATALSTAITEFLKVAFANNNAANNKVAIVQYDSEARAWDGSAEVKYNYSMTLSDYSTLTYNNCFMNTTAKVNAAVSALMTTPDANYTMGGMTNTMGGLRMAELVASTRSTTTTRDLLIVMFTDGLPTCRYFTSTKDWFWDNDGNATSAWEYMRALEAGQSLRACVDKYTKCKSTIYNIALLNSSTITSQQQKIADYFMSNTTNYQWTYDTNVNSDNYTDLTQYIDQQSTYFKTKSSGWAHQYKRLSSTTDFINLCKTIANDYTKQGYSEHNLTYTNSGDNHIVKCTQCEYTLTEKHTLGAWTVTKAATCTSAGQESATCSVCKNSVTRSIAQLAHTVVIDPAVEPTCEEPGLTEGSHCSVCKTVIVAQQEIPSGGSHQYTVMTILPTCTDDGYTTYFCEACGDSYVDSFVSALGHDYIPAVLAPSCTEGGHTTYVCANCDDSYISDRTNPTGHDYYAVVTAPTCSDRGYTTYSCNSCGDRYVADYTSPTDHDYNAVVTAPSCQSMGFTTYTCSMCGDSYMSDYRPALTHDYVAVVTAPTCTAEGYTTYICYGCNDSYIADKTPATGHKYNSTVTVAPSCTTDGVITYACTCGDSYVESVKASGHDLEYRPATAATCGQNGNKAYYFCLTCENAYIDAACEYNLPLEYFIIVAASHKYSYVNNGRTHTATCSTCSSVITESHTFTSGKCVCGAVEKTEPEYIYDSSLSFSMVITAGAEIAVSYNIMASKVSAYTDFYLLISKEVAGSTPITAIYGITSDRIPMSVTMHPVTNQPLMYGASYTGISAKEMGDNFSTTLFAIDEYGDIHYGDRVVNSIKDHLMTKIKASDSIPELRTMAVDMLKYGAAAQVHMNYNSANLVTKDLTAAQLAYGTQSLPKATNYSTTMGSGKSLTTNITINERVRLGLNCMYSPSETSDMTYLVIDTASAKVIAELPVTVSMNLFCSGTFDEVGAKDMRRRITVALYDGNTIVSQFLVWSVESYVAQVRANPNSTKSEINMANALLTYGDSVAAYMAATNQ